MRRSFVIPVICLALFCTAGCAPTNVVTLQAPVELRAEPIKKSPVVVIAPKDTDVVVLGRGKDWVPISLNGLQFYASTPAFANATPSGAPGPDPTCDYGYPYSGSGEFFARPLAQIRHTGPLGSLLGTHRFYPC